MLLTRRGELPGPWAAWEADAQAALQQRHGGDWMERRGPCPIWLAYQCVRCAKKLTDLCRVEQHLGSREHKSKMANEAYELDPLVLCFAVCAC